MKFQSILSVLFALALCVYPVRGDDDETAFRQDYAKAFEKMQKTYSNLIVQGVYSQYDESNKFEYSEDATVYVSGDKATYIATRKKSARAEDIYPVGSHLVRGGSIDLYFSATKRTGATDFVFDDYGPFSEERRKQSSVLLWGTGIAAYAPYLVTTRTLADLLDGADGCKFKSVTNTKLNGKPVTIVALSTNDVNNKPVLVEVILEQETGVILGYTIIFNGKGIYTSRVVYDENTLPRQVKSVETWQGRVGDETLIRNRMKFDVASIKFEKPPEVIFTPAGVGLKEVPAIGK
jgi:hypothetical protein